MSSKPTFRSVQLRVKRSVARGKKIFSTLLILMGVLVAGTVFGRDFPTGGTSPSIVGSVDLNGDGIPDMVVAHSGSPTLSVLLGDGAGGFSAPRTYNIPSTAMMVSLGDFNNDTSYDVVLTATTPSGGGIYLLLNDGAGNLGTPRFFPVSSFGLGAKRPFVQDIDGDGNSDVIVTTDTQVVILYGDGQGGFTIRNVQLSCSIPPALGGCGGPLSDPYLQDFNNDGIFDIAVLRGRVQRGVPIFAAVDLVVLLAGTDGSFSQMPSVQVASNPRSIISDLALIVEDVNGDGFVDVIASYRLQYTVPTSVEGIRILLGDGSGRFTPGATYNNSFGTPLAGKVPILADFNNDGIPDLVLSLAGRGYAIGLGTGNGEFIFTRQTVAGGYSSVQYDDLNLDGNFDLMLVSKERNTVTVLLGDGSGNFRP